MQMNRLEMLPKELILHILRFLPSKDLVHVSQLGTGWKDVLQDRQVWAKRMVDARSLELDVLVKLMGLAPCLRSLTVAFSSELDQAMVEGTDITVSSTSL